MKRTGALSRTMPIFLVMRDHPLDFHCDYAPQRATACGRCHLPAGDGCVCTLAALLGDVYDDPGVAFDAPAPVLWNPPRGLGCDNTELDRQARALRHTPSTFTVLPEEDS